MILKFDPETHTYWINDIKVPSVTQILRDAGIIDYSDIPKNKLDIAMKFGRAVHRACELFDKNDLDMVTLDHRLIPYVDAWNKFLKETKFIVEQYEQPIGSEKYMVAGTPDRVGIFFNKRTILDIKSSYSFDLLGLPIQTGGYELIHNEGKKREYRVVGRMGVLLKPDGNYKIEPCTNRNDINVFLSALTVVNYKKRRQ